MARRGRRRAPARAAPAARDGTPARASGKRSLAAIACLALVAGVGAVYAPVLGHAFVGLDDHAYFVHNPNLDGRLGADDWSGAFSPYYANWMPLTALSIALGDALHGPAPAPVLATNAALHALASVLLFLALWRMTGALPASAFVAAVFAVHPLHVESVAWASGRKDVLMGVGWTATLLAYAHYRARPGAGRYALLCAGGALAMLAKPAAVTLPFALLLLDHWPLGRFGAGPAAWRAHGAELRRAVLEKLPLFALAALVSALTLAVQTDAGARASVAVPLAYRLLNAGDAYAAYVFDALWPRGLAVFYPYAVDTLLGPAAIAACAGVVLATAAALALAATRPYLLSGWLWFVGTLVPMIGLVHVGGQARADRYTYIALIGLAWMLAFAARDLARARPGTRPALAAAALGACAALGVAAHHQVGIWRDSEALFQHAVAVTRDNAFAHTALGALYRERGDLARAERHLAEALRASPGAGGARTELALVRLEQGRDEEARALLADAAAGGADAAVVATAKGLAAERAGATAEAIAHYRRALATNPDRLEAANNLAWLLATADDPALREPLEALAIAERIARWNGDDPSVLDTLAAAYAAAGRPAEAVATQTRALEALPPGPSPLRSQLEARMARYRREAR